MYIFYAFINYKTKLKEETLEELGLTEFSSYWDPISWNQALSEPFIEKYKDKVCWYYISRYQILSEPFIEKYSDKVSWRWISQFQVLSEKFIEKWSVKLNWHYISRYQNLSLEFLIKYEDKISLDGIQYNKKIPQKTKDKFLEITNKTNSSCIITLLDLDKN